MKPYGRAAWNRIRFLWIRLVCCPGFKAEGIQLFGANTRISVRRTSAVDLGDRIVSDGRCVLMADEGARLRIGRRVYFNEDAMISCKSAVTIGEGCRFGPNVKIFDNNHRFSAAHGVMAEHTAGPVVIGEYSWIAANVTILKNTTIGKHCVIGAGCVVSGNIPDGSLVTQSQALCIKPIEDNERS